MKMECEITDCKYYKEGDCGLITPTLKVTRLMPIKNAPLVLCANFEHK